MNAPNEAPTRDEIEYAFRLAQAGADLELERVARQFTSQYPRHILGWSLLGTALSNLGYPEQAIAVLQRAIGLAPNRPELHASTGTCFLRLHQFQNAEDSYRKALSIDPHHLSSISKLSQLLCDLGKLQEAETWLLSAVAIHRNDCSIRLQLAELQSKGGKWLHAEKSYRAVLAIDSQNLVAFEGLGYALLQQGRPSESVDCAERAIVVKPGDPTLLGNLLFALNYAPLPIAGRATDIARQFGVAVKKPTTSSHLANIVPKTNQIRVGLVSGDFRSHSVAFFLLSLLENVSSNRLVFYAFPTYQIEDDWTVKLKSRIAHWIPISSMNDAQAAAEICKNGIQVLIDLSGHSGANRLSMFAFKPAPVQVSWLGYIATTGVQEIDFILSDQYASHPGDEAFFSEAIWRMPGSCVCYAPPESQLRVSNLPAMSAGHVTFGSFNNLPKISDQVIATWAQILLLVPTAVLYLKNRQLNDSLIQQDIRQRFSHFGIASERVLLRGTLPSTEAHLNEYARVDIGLDTFPYPGVTTSVEAMWMGVPVLTMKGSGNLLRMGESIAHNANIAHWIAEDVNDYINKAVLFASQLGELQTLRLSLRSRLKKSALFDGALFARHFEKAVQEMWEQNGATLNAQ